MSMPCLRPAWNGRRSLTRAAYALTRCRRISDRAGFACVHGAPHPVQTIQRPELFCKTAPVFFAQFPGLFPRIYSRNKYRALAHCPSPPYIKSSGKPYRILGNGRPGPPPKSPPRQPHEPTPANRLSKNQAGRFPRRTVSGFRIFRCMKILKGLSFFAQISKICVIIELVRSISRNLQKICRARPPMSAGTEEFL